MFAYVSLYQDTYNKNKEEKKGARNAEKEERAKKLAEMANRNSTPIFSFWHAWHICFLLDISLENTFIDGPAMELVALSATGKRTN